MGLAFRAFYYIGESKINNFYLRTIQKYWYHDSSQYWQCYDATARLSCSLKGSVIIAKIY